MRVFPMPALFRCIGMACFGIFRCMILMVSGYFSTILCVCVVSDARFRTKTEFAASEYQHPKNPDAFDYYLHRISPEPVFPMPALFFGRYIKNNQHSLFLISVSCLPYRLAQRIQHTLFIRAPERSDQQRFRPVPGHAVDHRLRRQNAQAVNDQFRVLL